MNIKCQWWLNDGCSKTATSLILACCQQGHIHERLLCTADTANFTWHIDQGNCQCCTCGNPLIKYLTRTPVENHWDLTEALRPGKTPIMITFPTTHPLWTIKQDGSYPIASQQEILNAIKALKTPVNPDTLNNNPVTRWIKKETRKHEP